MKTRTYKGIVTTMAEVCCNKCGEYNVFTVGIDDLSHFEAVKQALERVGWIVESWHEVYCGECK